MSAAAIISSKYRGHPKELPIYEPTDDPSTVMHTEASIIIPYLLSSVFLFYCVVSGNYVNTLLGKGMQRALEKRWMKHFIGVCILIFTISFISETSAWTTLVYGIGLYILFLLTTKMTVGWNILIFIILAVGFFMKELLKKDYNQKWENRATLHDEKVRRRHIRSTVEEAIRICFIVVIAITIVGNILYFQEKWIQHGGNDVGILRFLWNYIYL